MTTEKWRVFIQDDIVDSAADTRVVERVKRVKTLVSLDALMVDGRSGRLTISPSYACAVKQRSSPSFLSLAVIATAVGEDGDIIAINTR